MADPGTARRFEYKSDRSYKFWTIVQNQRTVTVTFGKIGNSGQRRDKVLETVEDAEKFVRKSIAGKKKAGYREVLKKKVERKSNAQQHAELENHLPFLRTLIEADDKTEPSLIYADWLMEHGLPQGEFIRCQLELADPETPFWKQADLEKQSAKLLMANWRDWLAELSQFYQDSDSHFSFRRGFLHSIVFSVLCNKKATALKNSFLCQLVQQLTISSTDYDDSGSPLEIDLLHGADFSSLLGFEFSSRQSIGLNLDNGPRVRSGLPTFKTIGEMRGLKRLSLDVRFKTNDYQSLSALELPELRHFEVTERCPQLVDQLIESTWIRQLVTLKLDCQMTVPCCEKLAKVMDARVLTELSVSDKLAEKKLGILRETGVPIVLS